VGIGAAIAPGAVRAAASTDAADVPKTTLAAARQRAAVCSGIAAIEEAPRHAGSSAGTAAALGRAGAAGTRGSVGVGGTTLAVVCAAARLVRNASCAAARQWSIV